MASIPLASHAVGQPPVASLPLSAVTDLALRLHAASDDDGWASALGQGLRELGLWHVLYLWEPLAGALALRSQAVPSSFHFLPTIVRDRDVALEALLADSPHLLAGAAELPFLTQQPRASALRGELALALRAATWAVLTLEHTGLRHGCLLLFGARLNRADLPALRLLAEQAASAIARVRALEQLAALQRRDAEKAALFSRLPGAGALIAVPSTKTAIREQFLGQVERLIPMDGCAVLERAPSGEPRCVGAHGVLANLSLAELQPLIERSLLARQPLIGPSDAEACAAMPHLALLAVPIEHEDHTGTVLMLSRAAQNPFNASEREAVATLVQQLAASLETAAERERHRERAATLKRRNRLLRAVNTVSQTLNEQLDLDVRLQSALEAMVRLGLADGAAVLVPSTSESLPDALVAAGLPAALVQALAACRPGALDQTLFHGRKLLRFKRAEQLAHVLGIEQVPESDGRVWVVAPLEHRSRIEGLLLLARRPARGRPGLDRNLVTSCARQIALSVANARLYAVQREAADLSGMVLEVARSLAAQADLEHVLATACDLTPRLVGCTRAAIWRYDEKRGAVLPWHGSGMGAQELSGFHSVLFEAGDVPFLDHVLRDGRSLVVDQNRLSLLPTWMVQFFDIKSMLLVPLIRKGRPLGLIAVDQPGSAHVFTPRDIAIAEGIASHAVLAIDNARLYEQTVRRADQLASLYETGRALSASLAAGELLSTVAESAARLVGAEWCVISLIEEANNTLVPAYRWPSQGEPPSASSLPALELARHAACDGQSAVVERGELGATSGYSAQPVGAIASVPVLAKGRVIGVLDVLSRRAGAWGAEEVRLLEAFAAQVSTAMENARLFQQLAEGKRAWEETFDAITDGICMRDGDCRIVRANHALARMVGTTVNVIVGTRLCDQLPELSESCDVCHAAEAADNTDVGEIIELRRPGPEPGVLALQDYPVRVDKDGDVRWVTVVKDVTAERRMQETLIRSEKMRALGEMASGVAHDFNNLLAAILARAELSLLEETNTDRRRAFEVIRRATLDGVATVQRIQEYSRVRHDLERREIVLNEAVCSAVELSRHKWKDEAERAGTRVDMTLDLHPVPPVQGNPSDLREVLVNLIFNAVDAMPSGGRITLRTGIIGDRAMVAVADTGCGMTEALQRRIFDPFFTTKGEGGSGLGLSISYGIVARYGGDIAVESSPNAGSVFTVRLPLASGGPEPTPRQTEATVGPTAPARILLVDDDPEVLDSVAELLRRDGHEVTALVSPCQALASFERGSFDYVITDLGMPELNGWELARQLRAIDESVPVILLTGWHAELTRERAGAQGIAAVLSKPCTLADLRRVMAATPHRPYAPRRVGLRVLVVDDQPQLAEVLAQRLQLDHHHVTLAGNGSEALARAKEALFDLAIVDLRLPDMDGGEVVDKLHELTAPPYIVLTTGLAVAFGDSALGCAANEVLPKPWKSDELHRVLDNAMRRMQDVAGGSEEGQ